MGRVNYPPRLDVADTLGNRSSYQAEARNAVIAPRVQNLSNAAAMLPLSPGERAGVRESVHSVFSFALRCYHASYARQQPCSPPAQETDMG